MTYQPETPFDHIESAQEFFALLAETVDDARKEVHAEIERIDCEKQRRCKEAFQLVSYNLSKLAFHVARSRRALNDLRTLRRVLLDERAIGEAAE